MKTLFDDMMYNNESFTFKYYKVNSSKDIINLNSLFINYSSDYNQKDLTTESFIFANAKELEIKKKIEKVGTPLKNWDINIYSGVLTGFNEAFIISTQKKEEILSNCKDSIELEKTKEIIKPVLRGRDIKKYSYEWADLWLIFITWHFPNHQEKNNSDFIYNEKCLRDNYSSLYNHLLSHKEKLLERNQAETGIRYEWYSLTRFRLISDYVQEIENKIVWQRVTKEPTFCISEKGIMTLDSMCFITCHKNIQNYLISFLNSKLIYFYIDKITHQFGDTGFLLSKQYVELIPIPQISEEEQKPFVDIVEEILAEKKENPNADTTDLEEKIDKLIYDLYGLTEDEINIIEKRK